MRIIEGGVEIETSNVLIGGVPDVSVVCNVPTTGQIISYYPDDDGANQFGIKHDFKILSTGDQSGTVNITINGKTHALSNNCVRDNNIYRNGRPIVWARYTPVADIGPAADGKLFWDQWTLAAESVTFNAAAKTITAAAGTPFDTGALCVGRKIDLTGTASNNIEITVANITTSVITTVENLVNEGPVATSFATKDDLIWNFRQQARDNLLGGYDDWEISNLNELETLLKYNGAAPLIDTTAFPSAPQASFWASTTDPIYTVQAMTVHFSFGRIERSIKSKSKHCCRLVRS